MVFSNSHSILLLPTGSYKEHAGGAGTTGIWVGTPWFGIAMIQKHEVQLPLMHGKLEEQGSTHPPSWSLEVPLPTPVGHVSGQAAKSGCEYLHASHLQGDVGCQFSVFNCSRRTYTIKIGFYACHSYHRSHTSLPTQGKSSHITTKKVPVLHKMHNHVSINWHDSTFHKDLNLACNV